MNRPSYGTIQSTRAASAFTSGIGASLVLVLVVVVLVVVLSLALIEAIRFLVKRNASGGALERLSGERIHIGED